ncbi:response regulator [Sphingomonas crocodyli]|uniref:Response regulator n=1 Tax=Sphingomonas crocodyli TaxID=1979270 RepID=A0A437LY90_9SPHN|nr:response regulator [Sphingomonas crocodyli]RVT90347.1 response regulator [Sphingomonas crocodyli]
MRIACLDDDPLIAEITTILLEELGHEVVLCADPAEALALIGASRTPFEMLVIDIHLAGGEDGRTIAMAARRLSADLRIIFFTGDTSITDIFDGATVLHKPCTLGMLEAAIERANPAVAADSPLQSSPETGVTAWTMRWGGSGVPESR